VSDREGLASLASSLPTDAHSGTSGRLSSAPTWRSVPERLKQLLTSVVDAIVVEAALDRL
jgi:hypothetical protein